MGTLVVVNRIAFLSGGIAHAAYGGIGISVFFGLPVFAGTFGFSLLAAMAMALVTLKSRDRADTLIGVLWAVGMALGVILIDFTPGYRADLMSYLFGSILTVTAADLLFMLALTAVVFLFVGLYYNELLAMSYDDEFARIRGIPVTRLYVLMIGMIAVAVVVLIRVVGLILVIALLTIPPFIAEGRSGSLRRMMALSALLSAVFCTAGLWLAYALNLTSGASIIMVAAAGFFLSLAMDRWSAGRDRG